jgi:hypothetical protein
VTKEQEKSRKKEEKLRVAEIERQRKREDREKERERVRKERETAREAYLQWARPRDDLQCDDHKVRFDLHVTHAGVCIEQKLDHTNSFFTQI